MDILFWDNITYYYMKRHHGVISDLIYLTVEWCDWPVRIKYSRAPCINLRQNQKLTGFHNNDHINFEALHLEKSSIALSMHFSSLQRKEDIKQTHNCFTKDWAHRKDTGRAVWRKLKQKSGLFLFSSLKAVAWKTSLHRLMQQKWGWGLTDRKPVM